MRLIDADALSETMYHEAFETDTPMQRWDSGCWIRYKMFETAVENAPTIEPEQPERKKGEWKHTGVTKSYRFICSACGKTAYYVSGSCASTRNKIENICKYNFCPNCGAEMRGTP